MVFGSVTLSACRGEELGRVSLNRAGDSGETTWKAGDVKTAQLWANYVAKWRGAEDPGVAYEVELLQGETSVERILCSTKSCSTKVCKNTSHINGEHNANCECQLACKLNAPAAGSYTVKVRVDFEKPESVQQVSDLSLVLRK
jgi:hypothetical protein